MDPAARASWLDKLHRRAVSAEFEAQLRTRFEPALRAIIESASARPAAPSTDEDVGLLHSVIRLVHIVSELGTDFWTTLADVADEQLDDLLRQEYESSDAMWKLVAHHLREAVRTYSMFGRAVAIRFRDTSHTVWTELASVREEMVLANLDEESRHYLRGMGALLIAATRMETQQYPLEDSAHWAQLAAREARRFEASMPLWLARIDAELPELRAKSVWSRWTAVDFAREFAPWPDDS